MDSEATQAPTLAALAARPELASPGLHEDFLQSMIPKIDVATGGPVSWPRAPELEWCPPGHGDIYGALRRSGALAALLDAGFTHAIVSNADNLGATADARIAAYVAGEGIPFLMEVVEGTEADRKGGHIARRRADGRLVLRETAQTPEGEEESFRDFRRWRFYNTNNLWIDLRALEATLAAADGVLELPLIVNRKTVDPRDPASPAVVQLESAMGAAISSFAGAQVLRVPRSRFVPVKTTDDLLVLRSDVYELTAEMAVRAARTRCPSWSSTRASTGCSTSSSDASRPAPRRCAPPSGSSCAATSPSAPASSCGERRARRSRAAEDSRRRDARRRGLTPSRRGRARRSRGARGPRALSRRA